FKYKVGQEHLQLLKARLDERHQRQENLQAQLAEKELELQLLKQQLAEIEQDPNTQTLAERQEELVKQRTAWVSDMMACKDRLTYSVCLRRSEEDKEFFVEMDKTLDRFLPIHWREVALKAEFANLRDAREKVEACEMEHGCVKRELESLTGDCRLPLR
ncbi:hypothetical protein KCU73_g15358, partial [Aureobasidium melanogenum]